MNPPGNQYQKIETPAHAHYAPLDGLRGLAILVVLLYHNFGYASYFSLGWSSLDLFFVLSGFLITDILLKTVGTRKYLQNFYIRRVLRIFPLYYLSLLIFLFILPQFNLLPDIDFYKENQGWLWTYQQNWLFILKGDNTTVSLNHLWSLAIEEQFYLVWPLVILVVKKPKFLIAILLIALLSVSTLRTWVWFEQIPGLSYYNLYTFSRIDGLCIGCLVALIRFLDRDFIRRKIVAIILFFAGINAVFFLIDSVLSASLPYLAVIGYTTIAMIFGLAVNEGVRGKNKLFNKIFTIEPLRFLGRVSYGTYIFHWPLYLILNPVLESNLPSDIPFFTPVILSSIACTLSAIVMGWLSFRFYESYFLRLKKKFT